MTNKKKLNIFKILLNGINLIEASAGTGKTFTIILLYLRCLLGIGDVQNQKKLRIHEILVLTFTNAAKEELYIRLKKTINNLYLSCVNNTDTNDPICKLFLKKIKDMNEAVSILKKAKNNIHEAAIYTIHSFCQKILQSNNFYINYVFQDKIIDKEDNLYIKTTEDFWRLYIYHLPENIIKIIFQYYKNPNDLLKIIKPFIHMKLFNYTVKILNNKHLILLHEENIKKIDYIKKIWLRHYPTILKKLNDIKINKKIYNQFNISRWINNITKWSESETKDYYLPIALKYFSQENIKKNTIYYINIEYILFKEIEIILKYNFSLKYIVALYAMQKIQKLLKKEKEKQSLLGFDDLLSNVLMILKKEKNLRTLIRKTYPIALIDEFQDTDIVQYKIFNLLYKNNEKSALFLIGDPKQAIYSFRGADVFSYLSIKSKIKKYYYLDTNWRSSVNMCDSINFLFSQNNNPFILPEISYTPIISSKKNVHMNFLINDIPQIPIRFFVHKKTEIYLDEYQLWIAKQCAQEISYWLTCAQNGQAKIITVNKEKILSPNDIVILVKNKKEANIIKQALQKINIFSIYYSDKNSVFKILDAQELLWILESILEPENIKLLQQSISTHILQVISSKIQKKNNNQSYYMIEKLYEYYEIWNNTSIFHMIQVMILDYQKNADIIDLNINYVKNLNFLHIAEILQEKFQYFNKKRSLIHWFQSKILDTKEPLPEEYIRNYPECQFIRIITIHKSKGLEYPIVWIPFIIDFNSSLLPIYHNKNYEAIIDITHNEKYFKISDTERLAEDIRLLYVAITRSIVHCCIGLSCLIKKKIKNRIYDNDIHKSSIGYIIQNGQPMHYKNFLKKLNQLSINNILEVRNNKKKYILSKTKNIYLINQPIDYNKKNNNIWNITSFTKLKKENNLFELQKSTILLNQYNNKTLKKKYEKLTIYNFPKGKNTGLMMHDILKNLNTLATKEDQWFSDILKKYNISLKWTNTLIFWIKNILNISLNDKNMRLSNITQISCIKELEFFLPIKNILYNSDFNKIIQSFNAINLPTLSFNPIKGILTGCIDLFFIWNKKYYILDYKSNWLGDDNTCYSLKNIQIEIMKNRYDLQYHIYTVAIHKYLKQKIKDYHYQYDFGGVFYFFLRAIENKKENHGVFYTKPDYNLIKKTIDLIS
ncbi:exodeoxyribonuclease V subunit beta [Buchnera aphidicola]|uniref:exodeoxyribonuclease V subunit beta n=1 Tax=Buchnera aphidicola TaxID=9 RepID=UPI003CE4AECB